jgi:hypothetical protein
MLRGGLLSARASARLAWSLCGLVLVLLVATLLVLLAARPPATPAADSWQRQAADLLTLVGPPLLGGLIAARRPENRYGWLWLAVGMVLAVQAFAMAYASVGQAAGPAGPPGLAVAAWGFGLTFTAFLSLFSFVFLLFPTGRLPSRRWRLWAWAIVSVGAATLIATAFGPGTAAEGIANPFAGWRWPPPRWPWQRCSSRPAVAFSGWWTGGSTAGATTPPRQSMRSPSGYATTWTWTHSRPSCWQCSTRPWSQPKRPCGFDRPCAAPERPRAARRGLLPGPIERGDLHFSPATQREMDNDDRACSGA